MHGPGSRKIRRPPQRPHRRCAESLLNGRASGEKQKQKQKHYVKREQHEHKLGKEGPSLLANTNAESARHLRRQLFEKLPLLRDSNLDLLLCGGEGWGSMSHNEICTRNRTKTCQSAPETRNLLHLLQGAAGLSRGCPLPPPSHPPNVHLVVSLRKAATGGALSISAWPTPFRRRHVPSQPLCDARDERRNLAGRAAPLPQVTSSALPGRDDENPVAPVLWGTGWGLFVIFCVSKGRFSGRHGIDRSNRR